MADDAAAPEGKLSEDDKSSADPDGATESPQKSSDPTESVVSEDADSETAVSQGAAPDEVVEDAEDFDEFNEAAAEPAPAREPISPVKLATVVGVVVVLALGAVVGWLGYRAADSSRTAEQRAVFLQVGRQAAINLTTIDAATVDADVQRILDTATDSFYDDFSSRTQPFVDVVRQAQSKSVGEVTSAGLESEDADGAQVLVAITVRTSNVGAPEQEPRAWRMRISVKQVGEDTKVSNVEFVP